MSDISITPANVVPGSNAQINREHKAGATIAAGDVLFLDPVTTTWKLADANANDVTTPGITTVGGIAVHAAVAGQPIAVQTGGDLALGSILTAGRAYVLSANAGKIAPIADLTTGWKTSHLGTAKSATVLGVAIRNTGITN